jgi:glycosyltransferase involved in cell wall biosynthesis
MRSLPEGITVCIAAYNEERTIGTIVAGLANEGLETVVVDDGSTDSTVREARTNGAYVTSLRKNSGQWTALRRAFQIALDRGTEVVVTFDADGQHLPSSVLELVQPILNGGADITIGSRARQHRYNGKSHRRFGTYVLNIIMWVLTQYRFSDCTSGLTAIRAPILRKVLPRLTEPQYGRLEFWLLAASCNARILDIPTVIRANRITRKGQLRFGANLLRTIGKTKLLSIIGSSH